MASHHHKLQNQINFLWETLLQIDISRVDLERAMKKLLDLRKEADELEEDQYVEEAFTIPAAILLSSLNVKKLNLQRRIQALLACIAVNSRENTTDEDCDFQMFLPRVQTLLLSINEYIENIKRQNEGNPAALTFQNSLCNMICKSPSRMYFKNGQWRKVTAGIDSDDPKNGYVVALFRRLRRQCQNIILLQKERDVLLLENDLLKEDLLECHCDRRRRRV